MNHLRRPLRINIGFLINQPAGYQKEISFELYQLYIDADSSFLLPKGLIKLARTQNGVRSNLEFSAQLEVECGRCLESYNLALHTTFEEIFTFQNRPLSEEEQVIPEDGNIDFEPLIRDYLLLEVPINPVCAADCRGLCRVCGANLNETDCGHYRGEDSAALSQLRRKLHLSLRMDNQ